MTATEIFRKILTHTQTSLIYEEFLYVRVVTKRKAGERVLLSFYSDKDLGKLQPTADIGIFVGYAPSRKEPPRVERLVSSAPAVQVPVISACVAAGSTIIEDNPFDHVDNDPFVNVFALELSSEASSSEDVSSAESTHVTQPHHHLEK
ncbi:hypothetical protein Tco_0214895 [Tanacetum coccineum]